MGVVLVAVVVLVVVVVLNVFVVSCDDIRTTRVKRRNIGQETKTKESEGNQKKKSRDGPELMGAGVRDKKSGPTSQEAGAENNPDNLFRLVESNHSTSSPKPQRTRVWTIR